MGSRALPLNSYNDVPEIGLLYDAVPLYQARPEAAFYGAFAGKAPGEVLEIGCGTGRVLLPIARGGKAITGVDSSSAMLAQLRHHVALEPESVRRCITIEEADARALHLERTFSLVTAPFRVFQHMVTTEDQRRFLKSVVTHLAPGGRFIFDVFNPRFDLLASDRSEELEDTPWSPLPDGRTFRRTARILKVRWLDQVSEVEMTWYVKDESGAERRLMQAFDMRWFVKAELEHLLELAGLKVEQVFGGLDQAPLIEGSAEMIWVCALA